MYIRSSCCGGPKYTFMEYRQFLIMFSFQIPILSHSCHQVYNSKTSFLGLIKSKRDLKNPTQLVRIFQFQNLATVPKKILFQIRTARLLQEFSVTFVKLIELFAQCLCLYKTCWIALTSILSVGSMKSWESCAALPDIQHMAQPNRIVHVKLLAYCLIHAILSKTLLKSTALSHIIFNSFINFGPLHLAGKFCATCSHQVSNQPMKLFGFAIALSFSSLEVELSNGLQQLILKVSKANSWSFSSILTGSIRNSSFSNVESKTLNHSFPANTVLYRTKKMIQFLRKVTCWDRHHKAAVLLRVRQLELLHYCFEIWEPEKFNTYAKSHQFYLCIIRRCPFGVRNDWPMSNRQ